MNRSEAYLAVLPVFTSGRIGIPDDPRLRSELLGLERRTGRSGKDAIDHGPHQHDDLANAVALAAWRTYRNYSRPGDGLVICGESTLLDGLTHNVAPTQYPSMFDRYEDIARNPLNEPWVYLSNAETGDHAQYDIDLEEVR